MFIIVLRFAENRSQAKTHMDGHKTWIERGFDDGVFLLVGSLQPNTGGTILAQSGSRADIERRVSEDPFVAERIVSAEILELEPSRTDDRLRFLLP